MRWLAKSRPSGTIRAVTGPGHEKLTNDAAVLRADSVAIWRGDRCLFEGLSFALAAGQLALLVGPNGAGKTTLLRVLAGLAAPTSGSVSWRGKPVDALPPEMRGSIAYRGHLDGLKKDLTVEENLRFHAAVWGGSADLGLLRDLKLEAQADTRARYLSAGQQRRAALVSLRVAAAPLWILDEPMTNLDAEGRSTVARWTDEHLGGGGCAVVATHQPEDFARRGAVVIEL
jgi:heme exporter protein A